MNDSTEDSLVELKSVVGGNPKAREMLDASYKDALDNTHGELTAVAIVTVRTGGAVTVSACRGEDWAALVGALERMKLLILRQVDEDDDLDHEES